MLKVEDLNFSYGEKPLYQGVSFIVGKGQKVGLVGPNGSGKSTLLKILTGREEGFVGRVKVDESTAIVPQEVKYDPEMESANSVKGYVDPLNNYQDFEIEKLFSGLELEFPLGDSPQNLSGGQRTKLALARALLSNPDVLLLDEPTNFMDFSGKRFVMDFLSKYEGTIIVVSHDLELMDEAIDKVLAINPQLGLIEEYKGSYSDFVRLKKEKEELLRRQVIVKEKHIKRMEKGLSKMTRFTSTKGVRRRIQQKKRIEKEKAQLPDLPKEIRSIKIKLPEPAKIGELPIRAIDVEKSYGDNTVLKNVNFTIVRGERIALIGPNGAGKSTFIKILMGILIPDAGSVVINEKAKIGYYSQEFETFDFRKTVLSTFCDETKKDEGFARSFLGRYMFLGSKVFQSIGSLSGGEKTRLSIAIIMGTDNNLLILDEPTTYLDVISQRVILESLKEYRGTMIVVSHTPGFIEELAPQKAFLFPEEKMVFWDNELLDKVAEV
jgi:ATPase subunit of ABC transporter with duplicated ATPase domains